MGRLALLVVKDLRRKRRAPLALLVGLSFPLLFAAMLALVFGSEGEQVPKVHLLVENQDGELLSSLLNSALTSTEMAKYFEVEVVGAEGRRLMEQGQASALLRIPKNFTRDVIDGTPTTLQIVRNPAQGILPEIAEQLARILVDVLDAGSRVLRAPLDQLRPYTAEGGPSISDETVSAISVAIKRSFEGAETFLFPPAVTLEGMSFTTEEKTATDEPSSSVSAVFLLILPGVSVYALFLVGDLAMRDVLAEATDGTLKRQLAGPMTSRTLVMGKALYAAILSLVALTILSLVAGLILRRAIDAPGFLALSFALILAIVGTSAFIYGTTGSERRGGTLGAALYLILGFAGGSFIPLDSLPSAVRSVAPVSPFYWGTAGYRELMEQGSGLVEVLPNVLVLSALGAGLLALGAALLDRRVRKGVTA